MGVSASVQGQTEALCPCCYGQLGQGRGRHIESWELLLEEPRRRLKKGLMLLVPPLLHRSQHLEAGVSLLLSCAGSTVSILAVLMKYVLNK